MNSILFVGGVHGAGKTTICRQIAAAVPASHVTAGGLIREMGPTEVVTLNKIVNDVDGNQELLLQGLDRYRARIGTGPIVLDGHFTLLCPGDRVAEVPVAVYRRIAPSAALLVETDLSIVHARLQERDGKAPSASVLLRLADLERAHAEAVCADLGIPVLRARGDVQVEQVTIFQIRAILKGEN